jgi:prepilin-type N-terminal cleavage/methylation domain-containing protein
LIKISRPGIQPTCTLVELLVVIAIIVILAALFFRHLINSKAARNEFNVSAIFISLASQFKIEMDEHLPAIKAEPV